MTAKEGQHDRPKTFALVLVPVGFATYLVHEAAHWVAGKLMGLDLSFSINGVTPLHDLTTGQHVILSAAGPAVTIIQAVLAFLWLRRRPAPLAFALLLWAAFMRLVASGISLVLANDEARIGSLLGIGYWTLPILVSASLCALAWIGAKRFRFTWRDGVLIYLTLSFVSAAIVFGDAAAKRKAAATPSLSTRPGAFPLAGVVRSGVDIGPLLHGGLLP